MFSTGVRAVGAENDFYTLDKLDDPYFWERAYAAGMDSKIGELFPQIFSGANCLVRNGAIIINDTMKAKLAIIMVMQLLRSKQSREFGRRLYRENLPDALKSAKEKFGPLSDKQNKLVKAFENDDFFFKFISMNYSLDLNRIKMLTNIIYNFDFIFLRIQGGMEFITSDNPVMIIDIATQNAAPFTNGLVQPSTAVYYPLSPQLLLCAMHSEIISAATSEID